MRKPRIFLLIPTFQPNDAVGNDVLGMHRIFRDAGYDVRILAEHIHPKLQAITELVRLDADEYWSSPNDILIYHHAIDWELGEKILLRSRNKLVIKYHNVTPAHFYARYAEHYYKACKEGRKATERLARLGHAILWGDSSYNNQEFIEYGFDESRCRVVPPVHRIEELLREPFDAVVMGTHRGDRPYLLFVGGLRPNKGHFRAVEVFAEYRAITDRQPRLVFVGNFDPSLSLYTEEVHQYARQLGVDDAVEFAHSVSPSQLRSFYMTCSVFLCVSEHEGFCVPLVEAMAFRVPIVAWATSAVGETAGSCGRIFEHFDAHCFARAIDECIEDPVLYRKLATAGRRRYEENYHPDIIRAKLLSLLAEVERA
ncbi:MAG: glycosyltransferase [Bryobacteraceae bacterium]|nr:glycosyltransferase [Bryobacteraceae bacterium]